MLGVLAVFLRDSIKRLTISGMILPVVALVNDAGEPDIAYNTHTATALWIRSRSVRFTSFQYSGWQLTPQEDA